MPDAAVDKPSEALCFVPEGLRRAGPAKEGSSPAGRVPLRKRKSHSVVFIAALAALFESALGAPPATRPATTQPTDPRDSFGCVERIVAVGDVHGDYEQFVKVLQVAKVINSKLDWIGGRTHLVQAGDVLDRAPDSRKAMDLLAKLEKQAAKAGGAVHALIGNHEAMVLLGAWGYVHPGEIKSFGGQESFRKAMSRDGWYGRWIRSHNAVVRIDNILFCHAGITPRFADLTLREINRAVRRELWAGDGDGIAMSSAGPLWNRTLALAREDELARMLDVVLKAQAAERMVIAHTVDRSGVVARAGGRLIRIDVGMSRYYDGPAACLLIENGAFYEVRAGRENHKLLIPAHATGPAPAPSPAKR